MINLESAPAVSSEPIGFCTECNAPVSGTQDSLKHSCECNAPVCITHGKSHD